MGGKDGLRGRIGGGRHGCQGGCGDGSWCKKLNRQIRTLTQRFIGVLQTPTQHASHMQDQYRKGCGRYNMGRRRQI